MSSLPNVAHAGPLVVRAEPRLGLPGARGSQGDSGRSSRGRPGTRTRRPAACLRIFSSSLPEPGHFRAGPPRMGAGCQLQGHESWAARGGTPRAGPSAVTAAGVTRRDRAGPAPAGGTAGPSHTGRWGDVAPKGNGVLLPE